MPPQPEYVEVAVNAGLPHRQTFSYVVPPELSLREGDAVFVPFGRRYLQGIVMQVVDVPYFPDTKPVDARIPAAAGDPDKPIVSRERVELAQWIAEHYLSPLFAAVALTLPPGFERRPLTYYESLLAPSELDTHPLPPRQRAVLEYIATADRPEAREIERDVKEKGIANAL